MISRIFVFAAVAAGMLYLWRQPLPRPMGAYGEQPSFTLFSRKGNDAAKKVKELERQLHALKKDQKPVGMDHIQRLWKELLGLWEKGVLSKAKAMELYQMLADIYWMSNPKQMPRQGGAEDGGRRGETESTAAHGAGESGGGGGVQPQAADVRQEIDRIAGRPSAQSGLSHTHYDALKKKLNDLADRGVAGLEQYYRIIEDRSPYAVAEADKKQEADFAEQKKRQEDPYYDCPKDAPPPTLTADFTDFSALQMITPPGSLTGDRDVAKGHFWVWTGGARVPLFVPIDAVFESMSSGPASAQDPTIHSTLNFKVKDQCGYTFRFGHITDPDTSLKPGDILLAGARVAYTIGNIPSGNWDIGFYNRLQEGPLAKINAFGLHRYGVCLIDYYPPDKRQAYRALFDPAGPRSVCQY